jgi:FkbM family methyltransferase
MLLKISTGIAILRNFWPRFLRQVGGHHRFASPAEVEKAELATYRAYLQRGMIVFDVGANVGSITLLFSKLVGDGGQVHAFEAGRVVFARLKSVCQMTEHSNIVLNHMALAEAEGIRDLYTYGQSYLSWSSLAERPLHKYGIKAQIEGTEKIITTTIDSYCQKNGIDRIDLLKIDVEGAEYQVLIGAQRMLQEKRIGCCVFEFGQTTFDMGNDPNEIENYLTQLGYHIRNVVKDNPNFPGRANAQSARFSMHIATPQITPQVVKG